MIYKYRNASNKRPPFDEKYFISAPSNKRPLRISAHPSFVKSGRLFKFYITFI